MAVSKLSKDILWDRRDYFIEKVKVPLMARLVELACEYPEPVMENTSAQNTHVLLEIWDKFFQFEDNPGRSSLFKAIRRLFTGTYEHDRYYAERIDWFLEELVKAYLDGRWIPSHFEATGAWWKDPDIVRLQTLARLKALAGVSINEDWFKQQIPELLRKEKEARRKVKDALPV